ncbi:60Kd inner membrane protein-domain-containing protein [Lipomyces tetrasporus]
MASTIRTLRLQTGFARKLSPAAIPRCESSQAIWCQRIPSRTRISIISHRPASPRHTSPILGLLKPQRSAFSTTTPTRAADTNPDLASAVLNSASGPATGGISPSGTSSWVDFVFDWDWLLKFAQSCVDAYVWFLDKTVIIGEISFQVFSAVHDITGLTWGWVIPITCILLRVTLTLPVALWSRKNAQRMNDIGGLVQAIGTQIRNGMTKGRLKILPAGFDHNALPTPSSTKEEVAQIFNLVETPQERVQTIKQFAKSNYKLTQNQFHVSIWRTFAVAFVQSFILFFGSRGVARYSRVRTDDTSVLTEGTFYHTQGMLWFTDLDTVDPYLILPVAFTALTFFNIEGYVREGDKVREFRRARQGALSRVFGAVARLGGLFIVSLSFLYPSSYTIYWLTSALYSMVQNAFMRRYHKFIPDNSLATPMKMPANPVRITATLDERSMKRLIAQTMHAPGVQAEPIGITK